MQQQSLNKHQKQSQQDNEPQQQQLTLLNQFKQQMLKAWQPVPSLSKTIIMFFILSIIFLGLGIPMYILSANIQEYSIRYDNQCKISTINTCMLQLQVSSDMEGPVFVYYQLHNYYQNHRLYSKSISYNQLRGISISQSDAKTDCDPIVYNSNLYKNLSLDGSTLVPTQIANPCGIVAFTVFNDTYTLTLNNNNIDISSKNIAWPNDLSRFKVTNNSNMWYNVQDQRFINWVRIASTPNFRKLWGRIDGNLVKGNYTLIINNYYDISKFNGQKYFVISQSNFFGSKNEFLSITYLVVGSLCAVIGGLFLGKKIMKRRKSE